VAKILTAKEVVSVAQPLSKRISTVPLNFYQHHAPALNRHGRWFLVAWLAALADGKIFLAIAASTLTYRCLSAGYQLPWENLEPAYRKVFNQLARLGETPLLASSLAFASTYGFAAAWSQLGGGWAALTLLGLGAGNLLFFLREVNGRTTVEMPSDIHNDSPGDTSWQDLSAADPLKRLLAVRSLLHWCLTSEVASETYLPGTDVTVRSHLIDCFRIMLTHESEPIVRVALIEGLKALHPKPQLGPGQPAIQPLRSKAPVVQAERQRTVEYVEP
jgi:hypothetical protein